MKVCGILIAKKHSARFPGKNLILFKKNAEILADCLGAKNVYMATDDEMIRAECGRMGIVTIHRGVNINHDDQSYLDVLKFAYNSIDRKYDIIVTLICNSIGHEADAIKRGIEKIKVDPHAVEARSFDKHGNQSGIFIFMADKLPLVWHHMVSFESNGKEIHYREELND